MCIMGFLNWDPKKPLKPEFAECCDYPVTREAEINDLTNQRHSFQACECIRLEQVCVGRDGSCAILDVHSYAFVCSIT